MKKKQQYHLWRSSLGACAFIVAFSVFVGTFGGAGVDLGAQYRSQDYYGRNIEDFDGEAFYNRVRNYHTTTRVERRRDYADMRDKCRDVNAAGLAVECPDINDVNAIQEFLKKDFFVSSSDESKEESQSLPKEIEEKLHGAAPDPELTYGDLNADFRTLLRQYLRGQICPEGMDKFLSGFHMLCERMINEGVQRPRRIAQDRAARARIRAILESQRVP